MGKNQAMRLMLMGKVALEIDSRPGSRSMVLPVRRTRVWESETRYFTQRAGIVA